VSTTAQERKAANSNNASPTKPGQGADEGRAAAEAENGVPAGDGASRSHAGVVDPAGNAKGGQAAAGRLGMGEVVGKEFERIFGSLFRGGVGVRSSNESDSSQTSAASSAAADPAPAVVAKLELSKVKAGGVGREAGLSGREVGSSSGRARGDVSGKGGTEQEAARSAAAFLQVCAVGGHGLHGHACVLVAD